MESEAEAEAEILRGEADAFAIEARAKAEAEKMAKKADAWKEYKEAAMLDMMLEAMPKVKQKFYSISSEFRKRLVKMLDWENKSCYDLFDCLSTALCLGT